MSDEHRPVGPPPFAAPPPPGASLPPIESTSEDRSIAMLAHLLGIFTWVFGALIIWLLKKDSSPFINDQGREALNFQITLTIAWFAAGVLTCIGIGLILMPVIWVLAIVFCIMAAVAANKGERYRYPLNIRIV